MGSLRTNRDLYQAITRLIWEQQFCSRELEEYLSALWDLGRGQRGRASLSLDEVVQLLGRAFVSPAPPFDEAWRLAYEKDDADLPGFEGWEARVLRQIVDLREMAEQDLLKDEQRHFGISSPREQSWYNFAPCTFLECATAGLYGGWEPGNGADREHVPGAVTGMKDDGQLAEGSPLDLMASVCIIHELTWDDFRDFLGVGQSYE